MQGDQKSIFLLNRTAHCWQRIVTSNLRDGYISFTRCPGNDRGCVTAQKPYLFSPQYSEPRMDDGSCRGRVQNRWRAARLFRHWNSSGFMQASGPLFDALERLEGDRKFIAADILQERRPHTTQHPVEFLDLGFARWSEM